MLATHWEPDGSRYAKMGDRGARDPRRRVPDYLAQRARWTLSGFGHECLSQNDRNLRDLVSKCAKAHKVDFAGFCSSAGMVGVRGTWRPTMPQFA
jgi:hypothetical protein